MFSQATADGALTLTVTFALGTDLDNAQVQVQNRVAQALPRLPAGGAAHRRHHREGARPTSSWSCTSSRRTSATTCSTSRTTRTCSVKDELARIAGRRQRRRSSARGDYACASGSIPDQARRAPADRRATSSRAIREQNVQVAAGVLGAPPAPSRRDLPALDQRAGPAARPRSEFGDIVVRADADGADHAAPRRRPRRARLEPLRAAQPARQQAGGGDRHLPARRASNALEAVRPGARDDGAS